MSPVPTWRLALTALMAAAVGPLLADRLWVAALVANGLVIGLGLIDYLLAPDPASIGVSRTIPGVVTSGEPVTLTWTATNPHPRSVRVAVADELAPSLQATDRRFAAAIPGGGRVAATAVLRPARRGRFAIDDVVVRVAGPLGLVARQGRRSLPTELRVQPRFDSRRHAEAIVARAHLQQLGLRSAHGRSGGTEFDQLREYTVDDEYRRIDWAATARAQRPIVRSYRAERNQTVISLLDNGRIMAGQVAGAPRVEHAIDATLMLTLVAGRLGDRCGLVAFDRQVRAVVPPGAGAAQLGPITDAVFDLQPELHESDYAGAFSDAITRFPRRALFVVFTDLVEQAIGESLLPALPLIARRHLVVVAAVLPGELDQWAASPASDADQVYRRVAATGALADRKAAAARLAAAGATIVEAPPGRLGRDVVDAYLQIKATGRL